VIDSGPDTRVTDSADLALCSRCKVVRTTIRAEVPEPDDDTDDGEEQITSW
jgi:hypothetical protein